MPSSISAYVWNPYTRSYSLAAGGKPIDTGGVRKVVDELRAGTNERLAKAAKELQSGALTNLTEFSLELKSEIKNLYISTHVLARGGVEEMDNSSWGMLGQSLREQYDYINSFVRDIENANIGVKDSETGQVVVRDSGIPELGDDFLNRVDLYTESGWGASGEFENVVRDREVDLGSLERRVLGDSKQSCDDCIEAAAQGWQPAGLLPDIGDTECITTPHSRVLTIRGWVPILEVKVGDYVLSHRNRWCRVSATSKKIAAPNRKTCFVFSPFSDEWIGCTIDHQWLTKKDWREIKDISLLGLEMAYYIYHDLYPMWWKAPSKSVEQMQEMPFKMRSMRLSNEPDWIYSKRIMQNLFSFRPMEETGQKRPNIQKYQGVGKEKSKAENLRGYHSRYALVGQRRREILHSNPNQWENQDGLSLSVDLGEVFRTDSRRDAPSSQRRNKLPRLSVESGTQNPESAYLGSSNRDKETEASSNLPHMLNPLPYEKENAYLIPQILFPSMLIEKVFLGSLEKSTDGYLYDITVDHDHSFVIEGWISHNCGPGCNCQFEFENEELNALADSFGGELTSGEELIPQS